METWTTGRVESLIGGAPHPSHHRVLPATSGSGSRRRWGARDVLAYRVWRQLHEVCDCSDVPAMLLRAEPLPPGAWLVCTGRGGWAVTDWCTMMCIIGGRVGPTIVVSLEPHIDAIVAAGLGDPRALP